MRVEQNNKDGLIKEWGGGREGEAEGDREEEKKGTENSRGKRENSKKKKKERNDKAHPTKNQAPSSMKFGPVGHISVPVILISGIFA